MRKNTYFIISSIIGILSFIYLNIFNVQKLIASEIKATGEILDDEVMSLVSNPNFYYAFAMIGIILFLFIIIVAYKNKLAYYRTYLLISSTIIFFLSSNIILMLIPIINILLIRNIPKIEKEKKEMPLITLEKVSKTEIIKSIILLVIYFFVSFGLGKIILYFVSKPNLTFKIFYNIITDIVLLSITCILFGKELIKSFKIFRQNFKSYGTYILKMYGLMLLVNLGVSLLISLIMGEIATSQNQVTLNTLPLWYLFPAAVIYAPIVEETVFRGCLRKLIKNDKLFMVISALSFGLLHTIGQEASIFNTFIYALPYMAMGFILARAYVKTNNISTNISIHFVNNFISCLINLL